MEKDYLLCQSGWHGESNESSIKLQCGLGIKYMFKNRKYHNLKITANKPKDIWLSDGFSLVQKEDNVINTSLIPGHYFVEFGLGNKRHPIYLNKDLEFKQSDFES